MSKRKELSSQVPGLSALVQSQEGQMMAKIVGMMTDPEDFPVIRLRELYSQAPTAVAKPKKNQKVIWNPASFSPPEAGQQLPIEVWTGFMFRDPLRAAVIYKQIWGGDTPSSWEYSALFNIENQSYTTLVEGGSVLDLKPLQFSNTAGESPHGPVLCCGVGPVGDNRVGVWCDGNATYPCILTFGALASEAPTTALNLSYIIWRWTGGHFVQYGKATVSIPTSSPVREVATFNVTQSGYYAVTVDSALFASLGDDAPDFTIDMKYVANIACAFCHSPIGDIFPYNAAQINGIRTLAVAGLLRNEASPLNQQGNLVMLQASRDQDWYSTYAGQGDNFYDYVFSRASEKDFLLRNGGYCYLKPTGPNDLAWINDIKHGAPSQGGSGVSAGTIDSMWFPLNNDSDYLIFAASCNNTSGGDCIFKMRWACEYKTENNWVDTLPPTVDPKAFEDAIETLSVMQQFFENPMHWKNIWKTVKDVAKKGPQIIKEIANIATPLVQAGKFFI